MTTKFPDIKLIRIFLVLAALVVALLITEITHAQPEEDRVAFVIGNSDYAGSAKLANPTNDSSAISDELKKLGFETYLFQNLKVEDVPALRKQLEERLKRNSRLVFYYAGHGVQIESKNYLLPINASFKNTETVANQSLYLGDILQTIKKARPRLSVVVLDACRDNPFGSDISSSINKGGLARVDPPTSTVIFYATRPGGTASDGDDKNGLFTKSLLAEFKKTELTLEVIFRRVSTSVYEFSKGDQEPWIEGVIREEFVVNKGNSNKPLIQIAVNNEQSSASKVSITEAISATSASQVVEISQTSNTQAPSQIEVSSASTPEKVAIASLIDALPNNNVAVRSLTYAQALNNIEKDNKLGKTEGRNIYLCTNDICTPYQDWSRKLTDDQNLDDLKDKLKQVVEGEIKICQFDTLSNKCTKNTLQFTVYNLFMLFLPKSEVRSISVLNPKVSNSGGLVFKVDMTGGTGITSVSCTTADAKLDFLNDRIDFSFARFGCMGVAPSTVKATFDVVLWNPEKAEMLLSWNINMLSFGAFGKGGGIAKFAFPARS